MNSRTMVVMLVCWSSCGLPAMAAEPELKSGVDRESFDTSVKPGQDFFQYANGTWIKNHPIPAEYTRWGSFAKLHDDNLLALKQILEDLVKASEPFSGDRQKLRDFYRTALDIDERNRQGVMPLAGDLEKIAKLKQADDLPKLIGDLHRTGISGLFSVWIGQDEKLSTRYVVHLWQGGLGLPERDYYLGRTEDSQRIRDQYRRHVEKMLTLSGDTPEVAAAAADSVLGLEIKLAEKARTPVELRDSEANYNRKSISELADLTPNFAWKDYWQGLAAAGISDVVVGQPEFLQRVNELLPSVAIADWQAYWRWHVIRSTAAHLSAALEQERFHFYEEVLRGAKEMPPQWKRAVKTMDRQVGQALGRLYVEQHFSRAAKQRMDALVKNVMLACRERIETRDWMGAETKEQALAKLGTIMTKIGYPDKWRDYSDLRITTDSYVANVRSAEAFQMRYELGRLDKPVDRTEWGMSPPTVNAYYNPSLNEIVFPAGILQPPFFHAEADDAVNYGAIGAVIGHEITHGFDDQGSRSDAAGNLRNWWTAEDRKRFNAKTDKLVQQYQACVALDDLHINGKLTLGENIADLGGVIIAYAAYQKSLAGQAAPVIDGLTGAQRFFLGFAQVWRGADREAEQRVRLRTDPHSPPRFRVLVPLANVPAFYDAFGVQPGDAMYRAPEDRLEIW